MHRVLFSCSIETDDKDKIEEYIRNTFFSHYGEWVFVEKTAMAYEEVYLKVKNSIYYRDVGYFENNLLGIYHKKHSASYLTVNAKNCDQRLDIRVVNLDDIDQKLE